MKIFYYTISDPYLKQSIKINEEECSSILDLKEKIALELHIQSFQVSIINEPECDYKLSNFSEYHNFDLEILFSCKDITFNLPNGKTITVKDGYKMKLWEVIHCFQKEGIYYSRLCIQNNLKFFYSGEEILKIDFPFFGIAEKETVEVKLDEKTVTIDCNEREFTFSENEYAFDSMEFIYGSFNEKNLFCYRDIQNALTHQKLDGGYHLKSNEKYIINIEYIFYFYNINMKYFFSPQRMDYFSKVSDAQLRFSLIYSDDKQIHPEDIIIYDENKNEIKDTSIYIKDICFNHGDIYFGINIRPKSEIESELTSTEYIEKNSDHSLSSNDKEKEEKKKKKRVKIKPPTITIVEFQKSSHQHLVSNEKVVDNPESIEINFIIDEDGEVTFPSFTKTINTKSSFKELEDIISKEFNIENKISFSMKNKNQRINIDNSINIENILQEIQQNKNTLYIKVTKPKKISPQDFKPSVTNIISDEIKNPKQEQQKEKEIEKIEEAVSLSMPIKQESKNNADDGEQENVTVESSSFKPTDQKQEVIRKKKGISIKKFMPKISEIPKSPKQSSANLLVDANDNYEYTFEYEGNKKTILLNDASTLEENEPEIRKLFKIQQDVEFDFKVQSKDSEFDVISPHESISKYKHKTIKIEENSQPQANVAETTEETVANNESNMRKYRFQTNRSDNIYEVELNVESTVKQLKESIASMNDVSNLSNIKVLFAGKDLLNDIILDDLEIGDTTLFVYIRSEADIFLMTANALKVKTENEEYEYEYEEEEEEEKNNKS